MTKLPESVEQDGTFTCRATCTTLYSFCLYHPLLEGSRVSSCSQCISILHNHRRLNKHSHRALGHNNWCLYLWLFKTLSSVYCLYSVIKLPSGPAVCTPSFNRYQYSLEEANPWSKSIQIHTFGHPGQVFIYIFIWLILWSEHGTLS